MTDKRQEALREMVRLQTRGGKECSMDELEFAALLWAPGATLDEVRSALNDVMAERASQPVR